MKSYTYTVPDRTDHVNMVQSSTSRPLFFPNNFEDKTVLKSLNSIFTHSRGYAFRMPKPGSSVLLIVSGGLDSTMLWFRLLSKYKLIVYPIFFQSPAFSRFNVPGEKSSVSYFYRLFKHRFPSQVRPVQFSPLSLTFSLASAANISILKHNWRIALSNARQNNKGHLSTYLIDYPTRFARYILSAYEYGLSLQAKGTRVSDMFLGVVPDDASIGREPTLTVIRSLNLFLCLILGDWKWQIEGPVDKQSKFYIPKKFSILEGMKYNIPLERTWSCVRQLPFHCGFCNACRYRHESFLSAKVTDRTTYIVPPQVKLKLKQIYLTFKAFISENRPYRSTLAQKKINIQLRQTKPKIHQKTFVRLSPSVETFKSGSVFFIRNNKTEEVMTLNSVGQEVVMFIEGKGGLSISSLVKKVKKKYPKSAQKTIAEDVIPFIQSLAHGGYLEIKAR